MITEDESPTVIEASEDDVRVACRRALSRIGLTYDELADRIASRDYRVHERLAWIVVREHRDLCD